ncbi:ROK family protein [Arundinibacter roseus]|uniref:ROK family protein n=1 Tax=Arundinibacter roseus TaxID=2070510 RepID=A0A4R4K9Z4_9BACT|nr:ROK family protein [Arundinibacter roseus]TDB63336.1 ROK family protein [Arundinibacter roseus]
MVFIGIDLGGTNIKGVLVNELGEVLKQHYIPTKDDPDGLWRGNVLSMVRYFQNYWQQPIAAVGLSAPGLPDVSNQCISFLPNRLPGLENFVWADYLGLPTSVVNDAHAALMAETSFGAAKNYQHVVLLTLGTGVGGGILIHGKLYQGLSQMAGHLGHITVNATDDECSIAGLPGSLEYAIGNYSIERRSRGRFTSTWELVEAYRAGDVFATYLWLNSVRSLAVALCSIVNALSPECIVLARGITLADDALFEPLRQFMDIYEWRPGGKSTPLVQAHFGDMAGAIGAAGFALQRNV